MNQNSKVSPDVIPPCGGRTGIPFLGGCEQNFRSDGVVNIIKNVTQVEDYTNRGSYIDPYPVAENFTAPDCSPYNEGGCPDNPCYKCGDFGITNNNIPCWPLDPAHYKACGPGTSSVTVGDYHNCFATSKETMSLTHCRTGGYKLVVASKGWPGRWGYHDSPVNRYPTSFDFTGRQCVYMPYYPTASSIKYLEEVASANQSHNETTYNCTTTKTGEADCVDIDGNHFTVDIDSVSCTPSGGSSHTSNAASTCILDKFGNINTAVCTSGSSDPNFVDESLGILGLADSDVGLAVWGAYSAAVDSAFLAYGHPVVTVNGPTAYELEFHTIIGDCFGVCGDVTHTSDVVGERITIDFAAGTLSIQQYGPKTPLSFSTSGYCLEWIQISTATWDYGAEGSTSFSYDESDVFWTASNGVSGTTTKHSGGSLSSAYTSADQKADCEFLLSQFKMSDPRLYPWRTAVFGVAGCTGGPYLTYNNERSAVPTIGQCSPDIVSDGSILGKPLPIGTEKFWDPYHRNMALCDSLVQPGCLAYYVRDHGAWSTDIGVPCATQWTDGALMGNLEQGALATSNQFFTTPNTCGDPPTRGTGDTLYMVKWALLIFDNVQRYNLARPCGYDRFQISSSANRVGHCISSITDHTITLEATDAPTDIVPGEKIWIISEGDFHGVPQPGNGELDGAWTVQSVGGGGYTVTVQEPRIISASLVPRQPIEKAFTGIIAKLHYQHKEAPGVCGRVDISTVSNLAPITCSLADPTFLATGDVVEIVNASGSIINGEWTITVSSSTQIFLNGSDGTAASTYTGSGQLYVKGAVDWKFNSTDGVGNFRAQTWGHNYRDMGEWPALDFQFNQNVDNSETDTDGNPCSNPAVPFPNPRLDQVTCSLEQSVNSISCSTGCAPPTPCQGFVAYFAPPGQEDFGTSGSIVQSVNLGWVPASFRTDTNYGSKWQGIVKRTMDDPLSQFPPPCPCEAVDDGVDPIFYACDFFWVEDEGFCTGDGLDDQGLEVKYYPLRDQFEAICSAPTGAPALPEGIKLGCAQESELTDGDNCPPNVCSPPFADSGNVFNSAPGPGAVSIFPYEVSFATYIDRLQCVCLNGQFKSAYESNGILCASNFFINLP